MNNVKLAVFLKTQKSHSGRGLGPQTPPVMHLNYASVLSNLLNQSIKTFFGLISTLNTIVVLCLNV